MPREPVSEYRLSPAARGDLEGIWEFSARTWSAGQAEEYLHGLGETLDILVAHPGIARERHEIVPPVRLHPYRSHLIVYRIEPDHLAVIRILHTRQHWQALLRN
jgi:toxin ParE1/3/4